MLECRWSLVGTLICAGILIGIHKHALRGLFGLALGEGSWRVMNKYGIERDLQYYHYMVLHPEDFQAPGWFMLGSSDEIPFLKLAFFLFKS